MLNNQIILKLKIIIHDFFQFYIFLFINET